MIRISDALEKNLLLEVKNELSLLNPIDIASILETLSKENTIKAFRLLSKDTASEVFSYLSSEKQQEIIESSSDEELGRIIDAMFLDDTVDLVEEMPAGVVAKILKNTSAENRKLINQFLKYPEDSAGSVMTVEYVSLKNDMNIKQALERIRAKGMKNETINDCFVVDKERKLEGTVPIRELIVNQEDTLIKDIMTDNFEKVQVDTDREIVADLFRHYDLSTMPVVDMENRLVGIITIDDIVDVIDQENTEDFQKMAAMEPSDKEYLKDSVLSLAKHRILWLLILMISATATGTIIRKYEDTLQSVVILAAFIPMLMDTGGNAGSQSSTLVIRGLALGEIKTSDVWKILWKEFRVSIIVGFTLAFVNFLRIFYFDKIGFTMTSVVCLSLFATVVIAKVVGGILPVAAKKLRLDPAIMASPLITTIVDACALVIYFKMATMLLHMN